VNELIVTDIGARKLSQALRDKSGYTSLAAANKALSQAKAKCKRVIE
jgi:hypothetical protein